MPVFTYYTVKSLKFTLENTPMMTWLPEKRTRWLKYRMEGDCSLYTPSYLLNFTSFKK